MSFSFRGSGGASCVPTGGPHLNDGDQYARCPSWLFDNLSTWLQPVRQERKIKIKNKTSLNCFLFFHACFAPPFSYLGTFPFSFSLSRRNSDPGSLVSRLFSPLPATVCVCVRFSRDKIPVISSLVNSHRVADAVN